MKDTLISYDTSVLAKDRGFDQECLFLYRKLIEGDVILTDHDLIGAWKIDVEGLFSNNTSPNEFLAPTQSLLAKWLRDEHGIFVWVDIEMSSSDDSEYAYKIRYSKNPKAKRECDEYEIINSFELYPGGYSNVGVINGHEYESVLEEALKAALQMI